MPVFSILLTFFFPFLVTSAYVCVLRKFIFITMSSSASVFETVLGQWDRKGWRKEGEKEVGFLYVF